MQLKCKHINLHRDRKRAFFMMLFFAFVFSAISILAVVSTNTECANLNSLIRSDYSYSVITTKGASQDSYYQFDAGISFSTSSEIKTSLNADILMQSRKSLYTDDVAWNADTLSEHGIAITAGLAKSNKLKIGDKLYSKHVVDGLVREYVIEQFLPQQSCVRVSENRNYTDGIIIMGHDSQYTDKITHRSISFTSIQIKELESALGEVPSQLVYRTTEITTIMKRLLPYFFLYFTLAVFVACGFVFMFNKEVKYNFKRLIMLGFSQSELNRSYNHIVFLASVLLILIGFFFSVLVTFLLIDSFIGILVLALIALTELLTVIIAANALRRHLWR